MLRMRLWIAPLLALVLSANALEPGLEERILWLDAAHTEPLFIPGSLPGWNDLDELPLGEHGRHRLEFLLGVRSDPVSDKPLCHSMGAFPAAGSDPKALPLARLIAEGPVSVLGEVVAVVQGWSGYHGHAGRLVYVEVKRVLRDPAETLAPGSLLAYAIHGGELMVEGILLCSQEDTGFYQPRPGDWVLLSGRPWSAEPLFLDVTTVFPIEGGQVRAQPYPQLQAGSDESVEELLLKVDKHLAAPGLGEGNP
jgi:hypothetical protein